MIKQLLPLFAAMFIVGCASNQRFTSRSCVDGKKVVAPQTAPCYMDVYEPPKQVVRRIHVPPPVYRDVYIREGGCHQPLIRLSPCPPAVPLRFEARRPQPQRYPSYPPQPRCEPVQVESFRNVPQREHCEEGRYERRVWITL